MAFRFYRLFPARMEMIPEILHFFNKLIHPFSIKESVLCDLILALDEASMNIIQHAYKERQANRVIELIVDILYDRIVLQLCDYGDEFQPQEITKPDIEKNKGGGFGLYLMKNLMDKLEYKRKSGKNITVMEKSIQWEKVAWQ